MKPRLIVICGPTATGKTEVAFRLAKELKTEIISFDSVQVYKKLDIGAAKPPREMLSEVKHHLIDELEPTETFTAGDFRRRALEILIETRQKDMILVGGTGFYLQALLKGMHQIPVVSQETKESLQAELEEKSLAPLYLELQKRDLEYSQKIHAHDQYRILRALEILRSGPKTMTQINREFQNEEPRFETHLFGLRRKKDLLRLAVENRTEFMLKSGLIDEVKNLLHEFPQGLRPLESVGYREVVAFVKGKGVESELPSLIVSSTLQLAKRQGTWFRRDPLIRWFDVDEDRIQNIVQTIRDDLLTP